jgi:hypothetical protein
MYTAAVGYAFSMGWLLHHLLLGRLRVLSLPAVRYLLVILYVLSNLYVVSKISGVYFDSQRLTKVTINSFQKLSDDLAKCDTLQVITSDLVSTPQLISSGVHLRAILFVEFNRRMEVIVRESDQVPLDKLGLHGKLLTVAWDVPGQSMILPSE